MSKLLIQKHKVEFWECDISGYVHNSKYFIWFERARFEIAKEVGLNDIEGINGEDGFYFPVLEAECKFINTIYMDTDLVIKTELEKPIAAKLKFKHTIEEEKTGRVLTRAITTVGVCSRKNGLVLKLSGEIQEKIENYFNN